MKIVVKLLLTCLVLWISTLIGWIDIVGEALVEDPVWNQILVLFILSLIIGLGMLISKILYLILVVATLGIGIFMLPLVLGIGFFIFWIIQQVLPGWMIVDVRFWGTLITGLVLGMIWFSGDGDDDD